MDKYEEILKLSQATEHSSYEPDRWVTPTTARERLSISPRTLERWMRDREMGFPQPIRVNGRRFFSEQKLQAFMSERAEV